MGRWSKLWTPLREIGPRVPLLDAYTKLSKPCCPHDQGFSQSLERGKPGCIAFLPRPLPHYERKCLHAGYRSVTPSCMSPGPVNTPEWRFLLRSERDGRAWNPKYRSEDRDPCRPEVLVIIVETLTNFLAPCASMFNKKKSWVQPISWNQHWEKENSKGNQSLYSWN